MSNIIQVIKSRRIRWVGYVAHMGKWRGAFGILVGKPEGQRLLDRPIIDGRLLNWMFNRLEGQRPDSYG